MLTYHCRVNIPSSERLFRSLRGSTLGVPAEFCCVSRQLLAVFHNTPMFPVHTFLMTARLTSYRSLRVLELRDRAPAHRVAGRNLSCARACPASFWRQCIFRLARSLARSSQRTRASCTQWGEENNWMDASEVQELCNGWGVSLCKQEQGTKSYSIAYWPDRGPRTDAQQGPRPYNISKMSWVFVLVSFFFATALFPSIYSSFMLLCATSL